MNPEILPIAGSIAGIFWIFLMILWLFLLGIAVLLLVFWVLMIVDVAKRKFKNENDRVAWILIIVLLNCIGAIVYYFAIKRPNKN